MSEWSSHIAAQECTVQLKRLVRMRFLCQPIIRPRMVAMGFLSRRSESLVSCGRTEAAYAIPAAFSSCAFTFCICRGLLFESRAQIIKLFLLRFHFRCALKFVEQHRVDHFVLNTLWLRPGLCATRAGFTSATSSAISPNAGWHCFDALAGSKLRRW